MKLGKKELLLIKTATNPNYLGGYFDFENNDEESFKKFYGLSMKQVGEVAASLREKVFTELEKTIQQTEKQ